MSLEFLILLRHGKTEWNAAQRIQGQQDIGLSALGLAQIHDAAPAMAALQPDVIISSDLRRAADTAAAVAAHTDVTVELDARLRETSLGQWEGKTRSDVIDRWPGLWEDWRSGRANISPPQGETRQQVAARTSAVFAELAQQPIKRALLVTHAGPIIAATGLLLGLHADQWSSFLAVGNCRWTIVRKTFGKWRLHTYNAGVDNVTIATSAEDIPGG